MGTPSAGPSNASTGEQLNAPCCLLTIEFVVMAQPEIQSSTVPQCWLHVRSGCPLVSADGYRVGTLCLGGKTPRTMSASEVGCPSALYPPPVNLHSGEPCPSRAVRAPTMGMEASRGLCMHLYFFRKLRPAVRQEPL